MPMSGAGAGILPITRLNYGETESAIFKDSFSGESNGTILPNHTSHIDINRLSKPYVDVTAGITIEGGKASDNDATVCTTVDMGYSDCILQVVCVPQGGGNGFQGLSFRQQDATHYLIAGLDITWDKITIWKNNGGVWSEEGGNGNGSFNVVAGTAYKLRVKLQGSSITVYVDDVIQATATITDFQTATQHGLYADAAGGGVDATWDDFVVYPV